jgi:diguanylate cyclase (GGDEF)-like protein
MVAVIGWLDYETGPEIGLSLLYLVPVALSGWFGGVSSAVIVGCFAGATWLGADLAWRNNDTAVAISIWNAFTRFVIYVSEGVFIALLHRDREQLKRLAARESLLARTDSSTGLPNARAFLERAERELQRGASLCVLYVDLDNFKMFNDRLGHAAGDDILEEVARILREAIGEDDIAARIGGDEFALLLPCDDHGKAQRIGAAIAERIREVGRAFPDIGFGATVGVVFFREPPENAEELLRAADEAMYRGKTLGKGQVVFQNV